MCHVSQLYIFFFRQSGEAYRWRVCYQRGLPCPVFLIIELTDKSFNYVDPIFINIVSQATIEIGRV